MCSAPWCVHSHVCISALRRQQVLWDSFLSSLVRQDTSPLARMVTLRLLYLCMVVHPKYTGEDLDNRYTSAFEPSPHQNPNRLSSTLTSGLLPKLVIQIELLLRDSPLLPNEEAMALSLGIASTLHISRYRQDRDSYWLTNSGTCSVTLELMARMYVTKQANPAMVHAMYDWSPIAVWLFSLCELLEYIHSQDMANTVLSDWLVYADGQSNGWNELIVPALTAYPEKTIDSLERLLEFATHGTDRLDNHLISLLIKAFLYIVSADIDIPKACWTRQARQRERFLVIFYLYSKETHVQQNILEYLFRLDGITNDISAKPGRDGEGNSKWWQSTAAEALSRLESYTEELQANDMPSINSLLTILIYILRHFSPSSDFAPMLRTVVRRLVQQICTGIWYHVPWTVRQNLMALCSCISWSHESPLVGCFSTHLGHVTESQPLSTDEIFLLTEHIQLLSLNSLIAKCTDEHVVMASYILFDELVLSLQVGIDYAPQELLGHISRICCALVALIEGASTRAADFLKCSPWLFTVRLTIERGLQSQTESTSLKTKMRLILQALEYCAAGRSVETSPQAEKKILKMKRNKDGILVIFCGIDG
ncbi:hypothetical protein M408DRAFT_328599 [Serendipita vermifera MAFF 305830]|uniref:Uncharacterized protein n=1 Tax=Serendipita vermifera MAFF 305830 TaxID=933852 RepID=A0A0C2WUA9_SERVB|nr:hypothetical protein M408DRAFT_328599 [Serendipita vermifera MAFF 305830]